VPDLPLSGAINPSAASNAALNNAAYDPNVVNDLYYGAGGVGAGGGGGGGPSGSRFVQKQSDFAQDMRGADPGAEEGALQKARQQQADFKQQRIQQAMAILQANKQSQTTNLPLLAAAGAMLAPTRTGSFSESLGNGMTAAVQPTEVDRTRDTGLAGALGRLGIDEGDVGLQSAQADTNDFWKRMQLAEQAGSSAALSDTRQNIATGNNISREQVAQTLADSRRDAAKQRADAQVEAAKLRANAPPKAVATFDYVTKPRPDGNGGFLPPMMTEEDAVGLLDPRKVANDPAQFARAVAAQEKMLADDNAMHGSRKTAADIHQQAVDNVRSTYSLTPNARKPLATQGGGGGGPAPAGQPAAAGAAPASGAARDATADEQALAQKYIDQGAPRSQVIDLFKKRGITLPAGP
jgi:hypothetical protein